MHSILVSDYMDNNPHAIRDNYSVKETVLFLLNENISGAPVIDEHKQLVGFISEKDCLAEVLNDAFYQEESPKVTSLMSKTVLTAKPDTSIVELAQKMLTPSPRNYPVVEDGKLVGMISRSALLKAIAEYNEE